LLHLDRRIPLDVAVDATQTSDETSRCFLLAAGPRETIAGERQRVAAHLRAHAGAVRAVRVLVREYEKTESIIAEHDRWLGIVEAEFVVRPAARWNEDLAGGRELDDVAWCMCRAGCRLDGRRLRELADQCVCWHERACAGDADCLDPVAPRDGFGHVSPGWV